jgi:hypothetical protein
VCACVRVILICDRTAFRVSNRRVAIYHHWHIPIIKIIVMFKNALRVLSLLQKCSICYRESVVGISDCMKYCLSTCQSQWPRGLRYEMSLPAWTLGSWVRIPLEAWMFVRVYSVFVLSCVSSCIATGWSLVQGVLPIVYKCKMTEPHKEEAKARYGLQRHTRRRRMHVNILLMTHSSAKNQPSFLVKIGCRAKARTHTNYRCQEYCSLWCKVRVAC